MTTTRHRMVIAVRPRVFSDALSRVLARDGVEIVSLSDPGNWPAGDARYDVAVVSGALPEDVSARVVIRIPEQPATDGSGLRLADVLDHVEQILPRREG